MTRIVSTCLEERRRRRQKTKKAMQTKALILIRLTLIETFPQVDSWLNAQSIGVMGAISELQRQGVFARCQRHLSFGLTFAKMNVLCVSRDRRPEGDRLPINDEVVVADGLVSDLLTGRADPESLNTKLQLQRALDLGAICEPDEEHFT